MLTTPRTLDRPPRPWEVHLAELRKTKIGPIFPSDPGHKPGIQGSRKENRSGKDTKPPYRLAERRRTRGPVTVHCLTCGWTASGNTWRPAKLKLGEHARKKHKGLVR